MANHFVEYLNKNILKNHLKECIELKLKNITTVYMLESSIDLDYDKKQLYDLNSSLKLSLNLLKPPKIEKSYQQFLFQIITDPNNAYYEFTVDLENKLNEDFDKDILNKININKEKISRIDKYGNQSACISDKFPDLRKYCHCKIKF